ncbi:MAG: leucyl/phenylalanyl-tRNA--protein transferase [Rhodoferax sp.]|jgi:leucyl/phenylalanyl-tRNA--protein transferase
MSSTFPPISKLAPGQHFPPASQAWGPGSPAPGLLAIGGALDVKTLRRAYSQGIFPWFSQGQPTLWWSPDPRMVLNVSEFKLHPSLKKTIRQFQKNTDCEVRIDSAFKEVIQACANSPRDGHTGTWIVPDMIDAYCDLHQAKLAHSVETWVDGKLVGGLYCVALGKSVFGESMFNLATDASKIALAALISFCRQHGVVQIDCQQNTKHLASLGARETSRALFASKVALGLDQHIASWQFAPRYWQHLLPDE